MWTRLTWIDNQMNPIRSRQISDNLLKGHIRVTLRCLIPHLRKLRLDLAHAAMHKSRLLHETIIRKKDQTCIPFYCLT